MNLMLFNIFSFLLSYYIFYKVSNIIICMVITMIRDSMHQKDGCFYNAERN